MGAPKTPSLRFDTRLLTPGLRLAVGVSGGADSVALLRALDEAKSRLGLVLSVAHLHHGLRGAEADDDLAFVRQLAVDLKLTFHEARVDVAAEAKEQAESIEEAARRLRYAWFGNLLNEVPLDAVATAHTLDDQAETVCAKFLRGAWTEGLGGIHPVLLMATGQVIRPLLQTTRAEVESYLSELGQTWREDSSNRDVGFDRNRIRHELLPTLETWNPGLRGHLAQMAILARDEEAWWQGELKRLIPQVLMEGKPVRGGGRASGDGLALDVTRFAAMAPALARRLLRHAAGQLGVKLDFRATETLRELALDKRAGQRRELAQGLRAERTPRELRLTIEVSSTGISEMGAIPGYEAKIPCEITAEFFGIRFQIQLESKSTSEVGQSFRGKPVRLRNWKPGDKVRLRHSSGPRKVKEVLERMRITGTSRSVWPVIEVDGQVAWMKGVELEPQPGIVLTVTNLL
ncbi:MAG: tRNA lysidine(34) synthetase TilS [Terracidiphilus sp.]